jgi:phage shock protein A
MKRAVGRLEELQIGWNDKAELALSKDREDLAKQALVEKQKAGRDGRGPSLGDGADRAGAAQLRGGHHEASDKLREARARQNAIAARLESAVARAKAREVMHGSRTLDAFAKFEVLERHADFAEGRAGRAGMTGPKSLRKRSPNFAPPRRSTLSWKP